MGKCIAALSTVVIGALLCAAGPTPDRLQDYLFTRDTHIDLDGGGSPDEIRRYDSTGRLIFAESHDATRGLRRTLRIEARDPGELRHEEWYRSSRLIRRVDELYGKNEALLSRDTEWSGSGERLDLKTHEEFHGIEQSSQRLQLITEGSWELVSKKTGYSLLRSAWDGYLSCLRDQGTLKTAQFEACSRWLDERLATSLNSKLTTIAALLPTRCEDFSTAYLENGMRIDLLSCATQRSQKMIESASGLITGGLLSCLNRLNPGYARDLAHTIAERRVLVTCAGTREGMVMTGSRWCPETLGKPGDRCTGYLRDAVSEGTGAGWSRSFPNEVVLVGYDPDAEPGTPGNPSYRFDNEADQTKNLGTAMMHELLHASGHEGYHNHNQAFPALDDVYGCEAICGTEALGEISDIRIPINATRENCLACMRSSFPPPDDEINPRARTEPGDGPSNAQESTACGKYPTMAETGVLTGKLALRNRTVRCLRALENPASPPTWALFDQLADQDPQCQGLHCRSCAYLKKSADFKAKCSRHSAIVDCLTSALEVYRTESKDAVTKMQTAYPAVKALWENQRREP